MSRSLCIIPARGGSKRIPKKNVRDFFGKPIIAYSIETALESKLFSEVMVSTDDEEIAKTAKKYGAVVPFMRSGANADDYATTADVLNEVLYNYEKADKPFDAACCIYPTAPLMTKKDLVQGFEKLRKGDFDSVFPVVAFSYPVWRGLRFSKNGKAEMLWPEHLNSRSQDLEEVFHDAGQWYWFLPEALKNKQRLFTDNSATIVVDALQVQDIDNLTDWRLAELKYESLQSLR